MTTFELPPAHKAEAGCKCFTCTLERRAEAAEHEVKKLAAELRAENDRHIETACSLDIRLKENTQLAAELKIVKTERDQLNRKLQEINSILQGPMTP